MSYTSEMSWVSPPSDSATVRNSGSSPWNLAGGLLMGAPEMVSPEIVGVGSGCMSSLFKRKRGVGGRRLHTQQITGQLGSRAESEKKKKKNQ